MNWDGAISYGVVYKGIFNTKFGIENSLETKTPKNIKTSFYLEKTLELLTLKGKLDSDKKYEVSIFSKLMNKISLGLSISGCMNNKETIKDLIRLGIKVKYED